VLLLAAVLALLPIPALAADLPEALATTEARTGVVTARLDLGDARRGLERSEADPTALRLDLLQARQALEAAESAFRSARFRAYADVAGAYLQVLEARSGVALAADAVALSERAVEIARIRLERGAATELDVRDAETDLASARTDLQSARQGADLAARSFTSLTGLEADELEPVPADWLALAIPDEEAWRARLDATPTVLQALQGVELARAARDLLDPAYAPARDIESAELSVAQAEEGLAEARRGVGLQLRSLLDRVASARDALVVAQGALANAEERDRIDRSRLDAGLIAEIAYDQTRLATRQARDAVQRAEHELVRALFALQADTGLPIEGLDAF
jgi:outer membrane protein TolC